MRDEKKRAIRTERQPGLYLERTPGVPPGADEVDEMVPEFMQRGFYRSQEGEFDAVETEPSGTMRAVRSGEGVFRAAPLRGGSKLPPTERSHENLEPVRSDLQGPALEPLPPRPVLNEETVAVRLDEEPEPSVVPASAPRRSPKATGWPRPVETTGLNLPLLVCLFFVVGLFMWREQTRPVTVEQSELPVPRRVRAVEGVTVPKPSDQTEQQAVPESAGLIGSDSEQGLPLDQVPTVVGSTDEGTPDEQDADSLFPEDKNPDQPLAEAPQDHESAAQRAAILDRMSAGTVHRNDRERRMENDLQDGSLFPETQPERPLQAKPAPPARKPAPPRAPEPTVSAAKEENLFPEPDFVSKPAAVEPAPQSPATGGKSGYQIAEPQL